MCFSWLQMQCVCVCKRGREREIVCKRIVHALALEFYRLLNYVGWLSVIFHLILLNICSKLCYSGNICLLKGN